MTVVTARGGKGSLFVGREAEFSELADGLDQAIDGHGQGFLVLGEPGIGKSRLASEVARHAGAAGALVLWGRCWEAGGAPPFWPWTEALREAAAAGGDGDEPPPLLELEPGDAARNVSDPARARFEVFDSVGSYLRRLGVRRPILIVLDDVHAADLPSLLLLEFLLGGGLRRSRVAIVAFSREYELRRSQELKEAGRRVRRLCRTIRLGGLRRDEVAALIEQRVSTQPRDDVVDTIHEATEGNPLFVEELSALVAQGVALGDGHVVPEGIRETIGLRLAPLPAEVVEVLSVGAVIGREFDLGLVEHVSDQSPQRLAGLVDEAVDAGVLAPSGPRRYRFGHILVRDVLYAELSAAQRGQLHADVGRAIEERHKTELNDHVDALAHHFVEGLAVAGAEQALGYLLRSARRAESRLAYEGAVRQYEVALGVAESTGSQNLPTLCDILLALGRAYGRSGRTTSAKQTFRRAAGLARQLSDGERLGQAALGLTERIAFQQRGDDEALEVLEEALDMLPADALEMRARVLGALARVLGYRGQRERMEAAAREAVDVARTLGEPGALADALNAWQVTLWSPDRIEERMQAAGDIVSVAEQCGDRELAMDGHMSQMICALELGDARQFDRSLAAYTRVANDLGQARYRFVAMTRQAMREFMFGHFERADELAEHARRLGNECEEPDAEPVYHGLWALPARDVGDRLEEVEGFFIDFSSRHTSAGSRALLAVLAVARGNDGAARSELRTVAENLGDLPKDMDWLLCLCLSAEVTSALGETATAATLYPLLAPYERRCALIAGAVGFAGTVAYYLGLLAATLGRVEQAEAHFATAAGMHADMGARPWLARTYLAHGRFLLAEPDQERAEKGAALLGQARALAEELGMAGLLDRSGGRPPMTTTRPEVALLRHEGGRWTVRYGASQFELADAKGLHYLVRLLARPSQEVHVLDLAGGSGGRTIVEGDAGPVLDDKAKASYRSRFEALREDLEEAEAWGDEERAFRARTEMDAIAGELAAAVGLGGRDRRAGSPTDRARVSVRKAIARVLRDVEARDPVIGRYLSTTIRTGTYCVYEPDPRFPVSWEV